MKIILAGLPGKIATVVANRLSPHELHTHALSSSKHAGTQFNILGTSSATSHSHSIKLISDSNLAASLRPGQDYVALDFSPQAPSTDRLSLWTGLGIPAVIGATGFDAAELRARVHGSASLLILAPNLALPLVTLQAVLKDAANNYPGAFTGFHFQCVESHQSTKKDISGTARSLLPTFAALGFAVPPDGAITSIRDPQIQREKGVPEEFLAGHGWHRYEAFSDSGVRLVLEHNVNGRAIYAEGALRACEFALRKWKQAQRGVSYDMVDVLKERTG